MVIHEAGQSVPLSCHSMSKHLERQTALPLQGCDEPFLSVRLSSLASISMGTQKPSPVSGPSPGPRVTETER